MVDEVVSTYQRPVNFVKEGIRIGIINAIIALAILFGSYYAGFQNFVDTQFFAGFIPFMFLILVIYGFQLKKRNGGYLAFKEGLQYALTAYLISTVAVAIATYILYSMIDPTLTQRVFAAGLDKTRALMQRMGAPQKEIDDTLAKASAQKNETSVKTVFLGMGSDLIICFMKSMLIAIIIRREKPQPTN